MVAYTYFYYDSSNVNEIYSANLSIKANHEKGIGDLVEILVRRNKVTIRKVRKKETTRRGSFFSSCG
jgi:hypothetical protein